MSQHHEICQFEEDVPSMGYPEFEQDQGTITCKEDATVYLEVTDEYYGDTATERYCQAHAEQLVEYASTSPQLTVRVHARV